MTSCATFNAGCADAEFAHVGKGAVQFCDAACVDSVVVAEQYFHGIKYAALGRFKRGQKRALYFVVIGNNEWLLIGKRMRYIFTVILLFAVCSIGVAQESDLPAVDRFASIRASLEDKFYSLAEHQIESVLRETLDAEQTTEARLLLAQALWGQSRYSDLLEILEPEEPSPGVVYWRARALFGLKRFDEALEQITVSDDDSPEPWGSALLRLKGRTEEESGDFAAAADSYVQFADSFTNHTERVQNQFDLATVYLELERRADAVKVYEALVSAEAPEVASRAKLELGRTLLGAVDAESVEKARTLLTALGEDEGARLVLRIDAYLELATVAEMSGDLEAAKAELLRAVALAPDARLRVRLNRELVRIYLTQEQFGVALTLLQKCSAEAPDERVAAALQLERANALLQAEQFGLSEQAYQVYLDVADDPEGVAQAYLGKAFALLGVKRYAEAGLFFDKASEALSDPGDQAMALMKAGDAYYQARQLEDAEQRYRTYILNHSDRTDLPNAQYHLGLVLAKIGRRAEAVEVFKKVESEHRDSPFAEKASLRIVDVMRANNLWEESITKYEEIGQAYTNAATVALSWHQRGILLFKYLQRYDEAQAAFETVLEKYPESEYAPQAAYMSGFCLYAQGQVDEAVKICTEFVEKSPESEWTPEVIFWLAEHDFNQGDYAGAEQLFLRIVKDFGEHRLAPNALYWAGRSAAAESNYVKAIEHYSSVAERYPDSVILAPVLFHKGDALSQLGRFSEAIVVFNKIASSQNDGPLVNAAMGRKGDCLFSLADGKAEGYEAAMAAYQSILDRPTANTALKMQAEYKVGLCQEKLNRQDKAFSRYMNVVYPFIKEPSERTTYTVMWFTRSAMGAAAIKERQHDWMGAVEVYEHVVEADVPARNHAVKQIERIRSDNWLLFE